MRSPLPTLLALALLLEAGCKDGLSLASDPSAPELDSGPDQHSDAATRDAGRDESPSDASAGTDATTAIWQPTPGTSWQWQLTGTLDSRPDVSMFDIDLFSTTQHDIASLHALGRRVVCYFDTAYEPERPDEARLRPYRGKTIDGWPDQNWLDIRAPEVVEVMKERIALAAEKQCDGVEADDVDVASNDSGFPITREEQRLFIRTLAREAHARGLAYGLKNALEDVTTLLPEVDFAVNEQCFEFGECDLLRPFINAGKAVFHVEYPASERQSLETRARGVCPAANALNFDSLIKYLDLAPARFACR